MERRFVLAPLRDLAPDLVSERDLQLADGSVRRIDPSGA
jgi:2-amino-4-hydroxy-6-hydroxymethyldihydropteridine diphosphokinase/dihydroneopterin aldolase/2-amino-4-hydroxy-6-hydroxymethyldihydropteridine diphosphokinase